MTIGKPNVSPGGVGPRPPYRVRRLVDDVKRALRDPKMTPEKLAEIAGRPLSWAEALLRHHDAREAARGRRPERPDTERPGNPSSPVKNRPTPEA